MLDKIPRVYPITDENLSGLSCSQQVEQFAAAGARLIQLRAKHLSGREFYEAAVQCVSAAHRYGARLLINDRADIALMADADGVHLGQDDFPPAEARRLLGDKAIIGYSTHNLTQALSAAELPVDYIGFGPIFATTTKVKPDAVVGLDSLRRVRRALPQAVIVAIGGINERNVQSVIAAGADSAAMISALLVNDDSIAVNISRINAQLY